ncbi:hypothetical protein E2C01_022774 [Portunus trituberculatus]|uniref:Uncharacterized protein n=1 Tax=Portunus trituberculatus TaxID=210409 RepID=A0A5B7E868_PORTR|nr:hypothetical protein [Portunus trituberculatus]
MKLRSPRIQIYKTSASAPIPNNKQSKRIVLWQCSFGKPCLDEARKRACSYTGKRTETKLCGVNVPRGGVKARCIPCNGRLLPGTVKQRTMTPACERYTNMAFTL